MAADGQHYASPDASICEARASACVSIYSRMFVTLPFRTVIAKTQWSSNVLFVALIFPLATPTTRTRRVSAPHPYLIDRPVYHARRLPLPWPYRTLLH